MTFLSVPTAQAVDVEGCEVLASTHKQNINLEACFPVTGRLGTRFRLRPGKLKLEGDGFATLSRTILVYAGLGSAPGARRVTEYLGEDETCGPNG